jgi:hypothetical protein
MNVHLVIYVNLGRIFKFSVINSILFSEIQLDISLNIDTVLLNFHRNEQPSLQDGRAVHEQELWCTLLVYMALSPLSSVKARRPWCCDFIVTDKDSSRGVTLHWGVNYFIFSCTRRSHLCVDLSGIKFITQISYYACIGHWFCSGSIICIKSASPNSSHLSQYLHQYSDSRDNHFSILFMHRSSYAPLDQGLRQTLRCRIKRPTLVVVCNEDIDLPRNSASTFGHCLPTNTWADTHENW